MVMYCVNGLVGPNQGSDSHAGGNNAGLCCDVNSHVGLEVQAERQGVVAGPEPGPGSLRWRLLGHVAPLNEQAVMSWEPLGSLINTNVIRTVLPLLRFSLA
jgi:hypothetical protein